MTCRGHSDIKKRMKKNRNGKKSNTPNGSLLRPMEPDGGRPGSSIIKGGEGAPPLTGEGPYESAFFKQQKFHFNKADIRSIKIRVRTRKMMRVQSRAYLSVQGACDGPEDPTCTAHALNRTFCRYTPRSWDTKQAHKVTEWTNVDILQNQDQDQSTHFWRRLAHSLLSSVKDRSEARAFIWNTQNQGHTQHLELIYKHTHPPTTQTSYPVLMGFLLLNSNLKADTLDKRT